MSALAWAEGPSALLPRSLRQASHWRDAAERLLTVELIADDRSWASLEQEQGLRLRRALTEMVRRFREDAAMVAQQAATGDGATEAALQGLRERFFRVETAVDFFTDALATRRGGRLPYLLSACDHIASASATEVLRPLGHETPPFLSYVDKGLGAAILKAGLRLWDRSTLNPVAAIRVTRHNLIRPTSVIHETGHQVAHTLDLNRELARVFRTQIPDRDAAELYAGWASEIFADGFGFAHSGPGFVYALHDVLDGGAEVVFRDFPLRPHPMPYVRVLMNAHWCRHAFGSGPWDTLVEDLRRRYRIESASGSAQRMIQTAMPHLELASELVLDAPLAGLSGRALRDAIDLSRVSPEALETGYRSLGDLNMVSPARLAADPVRVLGALVYRQLFDQKATEATEDFMMRLGTMRLGR